MKISKIPGLGRFGIYIDNVDLSNISDEEWMEIGHLHLKNLVTIVRNSNCDIDRMTELVCKFGDTRYGLKSWLLKKYNLPFGKILQMAKEKNSNMSKIDRNAVLSLISTQHVTANGKDVSRVTGGYDENGNPLGLFSEGELLWHSNESATLTVTPGVALLAHKKVVGSCTSFLTTVDYYESVSQSFRSELDDMIVIHKFTPGKINPGLHEEQDAIMKLSMCPDDYREVPMVWKNPGGLTGLHFPVNTMHQIKNATKQESDKIFSAIEKELFVDKYIYDHWYQNDGDFCLFDNTITLHRRLGNTQGRMAYRIAHDYTHLQTDVYQPFIQPKFQRKYNKEIRNIVKVLGIKNFKLPPLKFTDYIFDLLK